MCLIIASPKGKLPDAEVFKKAAWTNDDGFGVAYWDGTRVETYKTMNSSRMWQFMQIVKGKPFVLHFRWATHGTKDLTNVHPFEVGPDCWMAHNGIIGIKTDSDPSKSDTWHFAEMIKDWQELRTWDDDICENIGKWVGVHNKLAFLDKSRVVVINKAQGTEKDGLWYSNSGGFGWCGYGEYDGDDINWVCQGRWTRDANGTFTRKPIGGRGKKKKVTVIHGYGPAKEPEADQYCAACDEWTNYPYSAIVEGNDTRLCYWCKVAWDALEVKTLEALEFEVNKQNTSWRRSGGSTVTSEYQKGKALADAAVKELAAPVEVETLNDPTEDDWRNMTPEQMDAYIAQWASKRATAEEDEREALDMELARLEARQSIREGECDGY